MRSTHKPKSDNTDYVHEDVPSLPKNYSVKRDERLRGAEGEENIRARLRVLTRRIQKQLHGEYTYHTEEEENDRQESTNATDYRTPENTLGSIDTGILRLLGDMT